MGGKPRARAGCPPDDIVRGYPPGVVATAGALRAVLGDMVSGVRERGDPAAGVIEFLRAGPERFAYLAPARDHVRLCIEHGAALPDLGGAFEAAGPGAGPARVVILRAPADTSSRPVKLVLSLALYDDETHRFRGR